MIKLSDLLKVINCDERVKIISADMYAGITGKVEELESALNDSILHDYVSNVTYDDAVISIYVQPENLNAGLEDDGTNGWRCADDELPKYSGLYLALCRKPNDDKTIRRYEILHFDSRSKDWTTNNIVLFWHELPKYEPEEE